MAIEIVNKQRLTRIDKHAVIRVAQETLAAIDAGNVGLTVAFVRNSAIRALNREFRGADKPTDVLSFPSEDQPPVQNNRNGHREPFLGDVIISTDRALEQAVAAGHKVTREIDELVIHGVLHLCGYDHASDDGQMNRLELRLRRRILDR